MLSLNSYSSVTLQPSINETEVKELLRIHTLKFVCTLNDNQAIEIQQKINSIAMQESILIASVEIEGYSDNALNEFERLELEAAGLINAPEVVINYLHWQVANVRKSRSKDELLKLIREQ